MPPVRYGAATLVVVNKLDEIPASGREATLQRVKERVHERNQRAHVVGTVGGRIDPGLLFDVAAARDVAGQLSFRDLLAESAGDHEQHHHVHAESVTVTSEGTIDPEVLTELLDNPPVGVYRMKGAVAVRHRSGRGTTS